jgi:uncharacterized protein YndB with AHSA1/START domain
MATSTVRLHRVLRSKPERVYRAFLDRDAMAKWLPPYGFTGKVREPASASHTMSENGRLPRSVHDNVPARRMTLPARRRSRRSRST